MIALVDIGGTKVLASVTNEAGTPGPGIVRPTEAEDPVGQLVDILDEVCQGMSIDRISMALPGTFTRDPPMLLVAPNQPGSWLNIDLQSTVGDRYSCPVYVENDANCGALAEAKFGAGRNFHTMVYFTISTGIGSGTVCEGELVEGKFDTEGGHQVLWPRHLGGPPCGCGGFGCLEALASGSAIERRFGVRAEDLTDRVAWQDIGRWLGFAAINASALTACDVVVFGGGVCGSWHRFQHSLRATVREHTPAFRRPRLKLGEMGADRNVWGALSAVLPQTKNWPVSDED